MKKTRKKLILHRETIGNLADDRLNQAAGGGGGMLFSGGTYCMSACFTYCNCPSQNLSECCNTNLGCVGTYTC